MTNIFPSLIAADILNLADEINRLDPYVAGYHIDIMDFHFVPNLTWGPMFANAIREQTHKTLWVDLLVDNPDKYLHELTLHANDIVTIHYEAQGVQTEIHNIIKHIQTYRWRASLGINPQTPVDTITPYLKYVDHVLLMSVEPGFSGQDFVATSVDKLEQLNQIRKRHNYTFTIGMDGGIDRQTLPKLIPHDIDDVSIGSGIFGTKNPVNEIMYLKNL